MSGVLRRMKVIYDFVPRLGNIGRKPSKFVISRNEEYNQK